MSRNIKGIVCFFLIALIHFNEHSVFIQGESCTDEKFPCGPSGKCTFKAWVCDGEEDCENGRDENKTICEIHASQCSNKTHFSCEYRCIPKTWQCDRQEDCSDGRDERNCSYKDSCPKGELVCSSGKIRCIIASWICDGEKDCPDGIDEKDCVKTCSKDEFSCNNGTTCISKRFVCDGNFDCFDKSDEANCSNANITCAAKHVQCDTGGCVSTSYLCDGEKDCSDGSDESDILCSKQSCSASQWRCLGSQQCINITSVCDGNYDCKDESDERDTFTSSCSIDDCRNKGCAFKCTQTPAGAQCYCQQGYKLKNDTKTCEDIDECQEKVCDHVCINRPGWYKCVCYHGYLPVDKHYCKSDESIQPTLLIAKIQNVLNASIDGLQVDVLHDHLKRAVALDFHFQKRLIFFTDVGSKTIYKTTYGSQKIEPVLSAGLFIPDGIAVDWIAENIYFTESRGKRIDVVRLDGKFRHVLLENLGIPRGIAVDPERMLLFYTDWGSRDPKIGRCSMDGEQYVPLINTNITWPNAITLDYINKKVYWADARLDLISVVGYDGTNRQVIAGGIGQDPIPHPFAITLFQGFIYVTDWRIEGVYKVDLLNNGKVTRLIKDLHQPMDIQMFHASRQNHSQNYCKSFDCAHLGLLSSVVPKHCQCVCEMGFELMADGKTCTRFNQFLLVAAKNEIRGYIFKNGTKKDAIVPIMGLGNAVGIDFDVKEEMLYFSDVGSDTISRVGFGGGGLTVLVNKSLSNPDGVAVDWVGRNLYWTDGGLKTISVSKLDGKYRRTLFNEGLEKPRAIVVHPKIGTMFWADWGRNAKIEKAFMDGSGRAVIVNGSVLGWPNGLAIDYKAAKLYWVDAKLDVMMSINFNGDNQTTVLKELLHPFGMDVHDGFVYWGDWIERSLYRANIKNGSGGAKKKLLSGVGGLMEIRAYRKEHVSDDQQMCSLNGGCAELCLLKSSDARTCACQDGFKPSPSNFKKCIRSEVTAKPTCPPNHFQCNNSRCIFKRWLCDGDNDCLDNSDEHERCQMETCSSSFRKCANHKCVPESLFCDGDDDCGDRSDEKNCSKTCATAHFPCDGGRCLPVSWKCDGDRDCTDASDEHDCDGSTPVPCSGFKCVDTGSCLPSLWRCNGEKDCADNSDELGCPRVSCSGIQFQCADGSCLDLFWKCDGDRDCDDNSDEVGCTTEIPSPRCPDDRFQCRNYRCVSKNLKCNHRNDCGDWSDEMAMSCDRTCGHNQFNCTNEECINATLVCDGIDNCGDNSDEKWCPCTGEKKFRCRNRVCIEKSWTCDGVDDCGDASDEERPECGPPTCPPYHFVCPNSSMCLNLKNLCNGKPDCPGGEDETPICQFHECQRNNGGCSHMCTNSAEGALCSCPVGMKLSDNHTCDDVDECLLPWACSQKCVNVEKSYFCMCADGYTRRPDGRSCRANTDREDIPFILVSNRASIRKVTLEGKGGQARYSDVIIGLSNTIGVDFDWQEQRLYWTDVMTDKIQRAKFDGSNIETVVSGGLVSAEGIAVDWIGRNLYWLDMRADKIEVSKLDGRYRSVLISSGIDSPRAIQVDPREGYLFWTDWGQNPRIERAFMDGSNQTRIVTTKLGWPNGMTLDYVNKRIYWVDAKHHHLEFCDYEGENRYSVLTGSAKLQHPFSTTLFEDRIFWTDWAGNAIRFTDKYPGGNITDVYVTSSRLMDLHIVHPVKQPKPKGENPCANNPCSHLCVLKPNGYTCLCPIGLKLESGICKDVDSFLVYSRRFEIKAISLNEENAERMIPVVGLRNAIGVDFDYSEDRLYWSDVTDDSISRIYVNGTGYEKIIKPGSGLRSPDGIAVDWIAKNIYWTDSGADVIGVARTDGRFHRIVLSKSDYLDQPRGIAVYPRKGFLFWTDWGHNSIQRASLDGGNVTSVITRSLNFVNGLTIDYEKNRIYWADAAYDKIEGSDFHGNYRRKLNVAGLKHPFGISFFNGSIYWSDWVTHSINKIDVVNSDNQRVIKSRLPGIMDVCVFDKTRQTGNNPCSENNGNCPELCLWTGEVVHCACRRGYSYNKGNRKCETSSSFLVFTKHDEFLGISFDRDDQAAYLPYLSVTNNCFAADFLYDDSTIYFADDGKNVIGRVNTDGSALEYVVTKGLNRPHGIAVDWVGRNLYWTDMGTKLIEVSRLNGSHRIPIISAGLDRPRAIVLHPGKGLMFWTDWGREAKIEKAHMDGSNRKTLIANNSNYVVWPNGLTIDYKTDMLCWIDGKIGLIACMDFEGGNIRPLIKDSQYSHGYALASFGDYIYATFSQTNKIIRANKTNGNILTFRSTKSPRRGPSDVFAFDKSRQPPGGACEKAQCEQLCLPTSDTTHRCACADGQLAIDNKHCRQSSAFIIFAIAKQIRFLNLDPRKTVEPHPRISNTTIRQATVALDFDFNEKLIFFTVLKKAIMSVYLNGTGLKETPLTIIPDGISVDWISKKIYMTDATNDKIRRIDYNGSNMDIVVSAGLKEPRAIIVMPCESMMYWTDWGVPSIESALLNGINRRVLVNTTLGWPNGLTIDYFERKMYWVDARLDRIESALLDGSERRVIVDKLPHPFAISVFGSSIYWTDWVLRKVTKANKLSGGGQIQLTQTLQYQPMDIQVFTSDRQYCYSQPCADNGGCSHKCTPKNGQRQCSCNEGHRLLDDYWCVPAASNCSVDQFTCANGQCITRSYLCDTDDDCSDKSDELNIVCAIHECDRRYSFKCDNGKCIAKRWRCDFDDDCHDNSDEVGCERPSCNKGHFPCKNGRCISEAFRCDADNDCRDFSDETGCPPITCAQGRKPCSNNSMCIRESWICDGDDDCGDNSDESPVRCNNTTCLKSEIKCSGTGRCIPTRWRCDGDNDCGDNSDEPANCTNGPPTCKKQDFTCKNGNCISKTFLCDGDNDCGDNSDENLSNCSLRTCSVVEFKCYNASRCIPRTYVCDGDNDCGDASDEHPREGCKHPSCGDTEFRCENSICIRKAWRCDHENDCGDGSDERGCTYGTCAPNQFTCTNKQCISNDYKCDDDKDCSDGSDEAGCHSVCAPGEFKCREVGKCINETLSCNKIDDCGDNSDEKDCNINECSFDKEHKPCQHHCKDAPTGFVCSCKTGYALANVTKCIDVDECLHYTRNNCSQLCVNTKGGFKCQCGENYKLASDKRSCKYIGRDYDAPFLVFTDRYQIRYLSVDSKRYGSIVSDLVSAVAIDYDYKAQRIYWSSNSPKGINSAYFNGSHIQSVVKVRWSSPDGIAVDWVEGNLYFCESSSSSSEKAIYVSKLNGLYLKKLVTGLHAPRGMAVYPQKGYLFFTDWKKEAIFRVGMDGSELTELIDRKIGWPNGLTVDYVNKKLFWVDARLDTIEYADLNGKNRRMILHGKVQHPYAITLFEEQIYWTDWVTKGVHKANKWSGKNHVIMKNMTEKPMDIQVVHPLRQPHVPSRCPTKQRDACLGLCLLTPGAAGLGYRCACPENYHLAPDGRSCLSNCSIGQFSCNNYKCIPALWRCDGEDDCGDNSDEPEKLCPKRYCPTGRFQCQNHNCTSPFYVCDGDDDCGDGSDEQKCANKYCSPFKFRCKNHRCVSKSRKCDAVDDCGDGSDEEGCKNETCTPYQIRCKTSGECISKTSKCDGYDNCRDKSDEDPATCPKVTCASDQFYCAYRCIPRAWLCDDDFDCPDRSDEETCTVPVCPSDKFTCKDKSCIPKLWRCDHVQDCRDGSDEEGCTYPECKPTEFRCNTSMRCIDVTWKCNGQKDCSDGSDENGCAQKHCGKDQYSCGDGFCIHKAWRCDGAVDCKNNKDEMNCPIRDDGRRCSREQFQCNNTLCLTENVKCDGVNDCGDGSDEDRAMCSKHPCSLIQFRCKNIPACVPSYKVCDGDVDCPDKTDEPSSCVSHRTCNETEFKCSDGRTCVPLVRRCDQRNDCGDGSDETKCAAGSCHLEKIHGVCQQNCTDVTPGPGYYCSCHQGYQINSSNAHFCEDINECSIFGKCSQKCVNIKGSFKCSCFEGYRLSHTATGPTCRIKDSPPVIFIPSNGGIHRLSTSGYEGRRVLSTDSKIGPVDFLIIANVTFILWLDTETKTIKLSAITVNGRKKRETDSSHTTIKTIVQATGQITSFAVDWNGVNVYWINSKPTTKTIELSPIFSSGNRVLAEIDSFLKPKQLILYLEKNKMFWCSVGIAPKIEVANLTGGDRKVLVSSKLYWPTGIVIDPIMDRLFWCDMKEHEVETIFTNGTDRRVVLTSEQLRGEFSEPHSIDLFEDYLYIVTRKGVAFRWNKFGLGRGIKLLENLNANVGIKIFHKARQSRSLTKVCKANACSHICIPSVTGPICLCPDGEVNKGNCEKAIDRSCVGYCVHGDCQTRNEKPVCVCPNFAVGVKCELTCENHNCSNNGKCVVENNKLQCRCPDNTVQSDCPAVQARKADSNTKKLVEIIVPVVFGLLVIIAVCAIFYCRWRGTPSRKFAPFYGSRKASFTYTGMFDEDEDDDGEGNTSRQFVINDSEVNFANPVYNSLFLEGPSRGDYAEVNRQLIFQDDESRVDFSNPIYDSFYGSNERPEHDVFLPKKPASDVSSMDSFGSHDSLRDSMTRLVKDDQSA